MFIMQTLIYQKVLKDQQHTSQLFCQINHTFDVVQKLIPLFTLKGMFPLTLRLLQGSKNICHILSNKYLIDLYVTFSHVSK